MKKAISTALTKTNIAAVLSVLGAIPPQFDQLSAEMPPDALRRPVAPNERSLHEILAHLIHCEERTAESIYLALLLHEPLIPPLHAERDWGLLLRHEQSDFRQLLAYFAFRRMTLLRVLNGLSDAQWGRVIREEGKQRKESVYWRARGLALHEQEHIADAQAKLGEHTPR